MTLTPHWRTFNDVFAKGHHVMILMRGVPGSGKSRSLVSNHGGVVYSTDDFFVRDGQYQFQPEKLEEYHRNNILRVREAMVDGIKPIIVDNTNIYSNHMEQYTFHAVNNYYEIFVLEPETWWKYKAHECFIRNTHGLEKEKIAFMLNSLEEQGKPPLSRLVGRGRQVRLEPPCIEAISGIDGKIGLDCSRADLRAPDNSFAFTLEVSSDDRPPGLSQQNSSSSSGSPSPSATSAPSSLLSPISLAVDLRFTRAIVNITLTCAGISCFVDDVIEGTSQEIERLREGKPAMKDRVVKMENIPQVSEMDVLIAIFPYEEIVNLTHYYQGAFVEELAAAEISATRVHAPPPISNWQRLADQEDMKGLSMSKPLQHVQCYDAYAPLENIQRCIREGHHVMILMRGVPGSGKSYLASTDDFFVRDGQYQFQPEKLEEYHRNNILRGNTNFLAVNNYYEIFVLEPETWWKYKAHECFILEPPCIEAISGIDGKIGLDCSRADLRGSALLLSTFKELIAVVVLLDLLHPLPHLHLLSLLSPISLAVDLRSHVRSLTVRDMSTQTNEVVVTLTCAGISCFVDDVIEGTSQEIERLREGKPAMKDRVVKMENIPQVSEMDVLIAIFPYEEIVNLTHYYQMLGLDECVKLFVELGAYIDWSASVVEGAFVEELAAAEISATRVHAPPPISNWQRLADQEDMKDKPAATPTQMDPAEAEVKGVTVTLGLDLLQKMSVLFGNGAAIEQECSVRVPLWILEQLYLVWRGDDGQEHHSDAQLAAFLQEDETNFESTVSSPHIKRNLTVAQKLQLNKLLEEFSSCDDQSVKRIFEDNKYDAEATRSTLNFMLNPDIEIVEQPFTAANNKVAPATTPRRRPPPEISLSLAQEQAIQIRKEADLHAEKRSQENQKAQRYIRNGMPAAAGAFQQVAREHALREKCLREEASRIIIKAQEQSNVLDFHLLSQKEALSLLRDRLAVLDRPEAKRNGRSDRRLHVITGYGKSSGGRAVIKTAVESYLRNKGYYYSFANMGEIVIQCK
ncbi:Smr domain protein [Ostertagia ostertagi]